MGKEWLHWGIGGASGGSRKRGRLKNEERDVSSPGCMCAVIQLFDLHQFQLPLNHRPSLKPRDYVLPEEPTDLRGVVAPRNSMELEEPLMDAASLQSTIKKEAENLNIQMGIQIKTTNDSNARADHDLCSVYSRNSPTAKTPTLVARLMGLDLLPESTCPASFSSSNPTSRSSFHPQLQILKHLRDRPGLHHDATTGGSRSLPETPRISSARRSDVEHHRLSLQINKDNIPMSEELELSSYLRCKVGKRREFRQEDENRSPAHYVRHIVKQVKENLSSRVGADITNTVKNRGQGKEELVIFLKSKKPSRELITRVGGESSTSKQSTPSCSPRLRFMEPKNKPEAASTCERNQSSQSPKLSTAPLSLSINKHQQPAKVQSKLKHQELALEQQFSQTNSAIKCKKVSNDRFSPPLKKPPPTSEIIRNKQEETFVRSPTTKANHLDKKNKKTPLSNDLLNVNVPTLFPLKKDSSPPATKVPHLQSQESDTLIPRSSSIQLPRCSSHSYREQRTRTPTINGNSATTVTSSFGDGTEFQYISRILKRTDIDMDTPVPVSPTNWYSLSHPLNPSIFHELELSYSNVTISTASDRDSTSTLPLTAQQYNRKLMFHLIDELLADILKPYMSLKPWVNVHATKQGRLIRGSELIEILWSRIGSFPVADCRVLEDIDALIDKDLCRTQIQGLTAYEEDGESIVKEIERGIVDGLLHETAVTVRHVRGGGRWHRI